MAHCYTKYVEYPDISCSECNIKKEGSKMLAVHFYSTKSNEYLGEGFYISDFEIFENYALNHLQAKKIKDNKYELPDGKRYICLENWKSRRGVR